MAPGRRTGGTTLSVWGRDLSDEVEKRFPSVSLLPIEWRSGQLGRATQILPVVGSEPWFDEEELRERTIAFHGKAREECGACGVWRWYPLSWRRRRFRRFERESRMT